MNCWTQCTARAVPLAEAAVDPTVLRQTSLILPCSPRSGFSALRPSRSILGLCPVGEGAHDGNDESEQEGEPRPGGGQGIFPFAHGDDLHLRPTESGRGHHDHEQQAGDGLGTGGCHAARLGAGFLDPPLEGTFVESRIFEDHRDYSPFSGIYRKGAPRPEHKVRFRPGPQAVGCLRSAQRAKGKTSALFGIRGLPTGAPVFGAARQPRRSGPGARSS